jgi:hypothetical protein
MLSSPCHELTAPKVRIEEHHDPDLHPGGATSVRGVISLAVKGTLVCHTNGSPGGGNSTLVQTAAVPLSSDGDAKFSGSVGSLPAVCSARNLNPCYAG